jgi:hypothetical protein
MGAIVRSYVDEQGRPIDHHVGSYLVKDKMGSTYRVNYNVEMLGNNLIVNMDEVRGVRRVNCDLTNIELVVDFNSVPDAYNFYRSVTSGPDRFVTGGKYNCSEVQLDAMMLMRKVIDVEINGISVLLRTTQGTYEDIIKDGDMTVDRIETPGEHSKTFCFGVNVNEDCDKAKRPLPIFKNKYFDVTCSNCFVGAKATAFFDLKISWFKLRRVAAGLKDIQINGAFVLDLAAEGSASCGTDKTYRLVDAGLIVQFWIGPIPVVIWYEVPLRVVANAQMQASATATAGAKANWKFGDAYVKWDENSGWGVVRPHPSFTWEPQIKGQATLNAEASLSVQPSFIVHVMRLVETGIHVAPTIMATAKGDTEKKELCLDLNYEIKAEVHAAVSINLPIIKLFEKKFGPYEVVNTGVKPIGHWCIKA